MQCEFLEEYQVRTPEGIHTVRAGSVYFIHPDKAIHLLVAGRVRPVDYGAVRFLPYIDEQGYLTTMSRDQAQTQWKEELKTDEIVKDIYRMRDDSERYWLHLNDMASSGSRLTPEEIERECYKMFCENFAHYITGKGLMYEGRIFKRVFRPDCVRRDKDSCIRGRP